MIPELQTFGEQEHLESLALLQGAFQPYPGGVHGNPLREGEQGLHIQLVVRLPRTSLSSCERAAKTPSMNLPAGVSSIGWLTALKVTPSPAR